MKNPLQSLSGFQTSGFAVIVGITLMAMLGVNRAISWLTYSAEPDAEAKTEIVQP